MGNINRLYANIMRRSQQSQRRGQVRFLEQGAVQLSGESD